MLPHELLKSIADTTRVNKSGVSTIPGLHGTASVVQRGKEPLMRYTRANLKAAVDEINQIVEPFMSSPKSS